MGLPHLLSTLRRTSRLLSKISKHTRKLSTASHTALTSLTAVEHSTLRGASTAPNPNITIDEEAKKEKQKLNQKLQSKLEKMQTAKDAEMRLAELTADVAMAVSTVQKYQTVSMGYPVWFGGVDMYTADLEEGEEGLIKSFMFKTSGSTCLEALLKSPVGADGDGDDEEDMEREEVMPEEVFATYRAIGCQTWPMFEVGVHRLVEGVADLVWDVAREMGLIELDAVGGGQEEAGVEEVGTMVQEKEENMTVVKEELKDEGIGMGSDA